MSGLNSIPSSEKRVRRRKIFKSDNRSASGAYSIISSRAKDLVGRALLGLRRDSSGRDDRFELQAFQPVSLIQYLFSPHKRTRGQRYPKRRKSSPRLSGRTLDEGLFRGWVVSGIKAPVRDNWEYFSVSYLPCSRHRNSPLIDTNSSGPRVPCSRIVKTVQTFILEFFTRHDTR